MKFIVELEYEPVDPYARLRSRYPTDYPNFTKAYILKDVEEAVAQGLGEYSRTVQDRYSGVVKKVTIVDE